VSHQNTPEAAAAAEREREREREKEGGREGGREGEKKKTQGHALATHAAGMMSSSSESEFLERTRRLADDAAALRSATICLQQLRFARNGCCVCVLCFTEAVVVLCALRI
jgi:hypothetical protein